MPRVKSSRARRNTKRAAVTQLPRIGPSGPPAGIVSRDDSGLSTTHPLVGADVADISSIMLSAFRGQPDRLQNLYDDLLDRDARIGAVCATRIGVIQHRSWSVQPPEEAKDDNEAKRIAASVTEIVRKIQDGEGQGWTSVVGDMADGVLRSYSIGEIEWGVNRKGWHVPLRIHHRHPRRFCFDEDMRPMFSDLGDWSGTALDAWGPDKFVTHMPKAGRSSYPTRRGVMLGMVFPALFKRFGWKWWLKGVERWGQPLVVLDLPENRDDLRDEAKALVRRLKSDFAGVLWGGIKFAQVPGSGDLNGDIYQALIDKVDTDIAIRALGQNLTTEVQGGSYAAAKVSNLIRLDILASDLAELDATINAQIVKPIIKYNWPGVPEPVYCTEIGERGDITIEAVSAGLFDEDEYRGYLGYAPRERDPEEEIVTTEKFSGIQVTSMQGIVTAVVQGQLPRDSAVAMLQIAFQLGADDAEAILGSAGQSFVPTVVGEPQQEQPQAEGGAPEEPAPFPEDSQEPRSQRSKAARSVTIPDTTWPTSESLTDLRAIELYRQLVE